MRSIRLVLGLASLLAASSALANTYTVTSTADAGAGSLRQAILDANANSGTDTIAFNIPGSGVHTIAPATPLPNLTSPVTVDGYTQPGASPNTNPPDQGLNSVLQIEIDCTNAGTYCLVIGADDTTLRGLVLNRGIGGVATDFLKEVQNPVVEGCFLGTSPDGLTPLALPDGVTFGHHLNGRIGGTTPAARNLFASTGSGTLVQVELRRQQRLRHPGEPLLYRQDRPCPDRVRCHPHRDPAFRRFRRRQYLEHDDRRTDPGRGQRLRLSGQRSPTVEHGGCRGPGQQIRRRSERHQGDLPRPRQRRVRRGRRRHGRDWRNGGRRR